MLKEHEEEKVACRNVHKALNDFLMLMFIIHFITPMYSNLLYKCKQSLMIANENISNQLF